MASVDHRIQGLASVLLLAGATTLLAVAEPVGVPDGSGTTRDRETSQRIQVSSPAVGTAPGQSFTGITLAGRRPTRDEALCTRLTDRLGSDRPIEILETNQTKAGAITIVACWPDTRSLVRALRRLGASTDRSLVTRVASVVTVPHAVGPVLQVTLQKDPVPGPHQLFGHATAIERILDAAGADARPGLRLESVVARPGSRMVTVDVHLSDSRPAIGEFLRRAALFARIDQSTVVEEDGPRERGLVTLSMQVP